MSAATSQPQQRQSPFYETLSELLQSQMPGTSDDAFSTLGASIVSMSPASPHYSTMAPSKPHLADLPNAGIAPKGGSAFLLGPNFTDRREASQDVAPFDSPFDQSLGSPASARDWGSPALVEHEPALIAAHDHGTQDSESTSHADWLAGIDLFSDDWPQSLSRAADMPNGSQSQQTPGITAPTSAILVKDANAQSSSVDFSFDHLLATSGAANKAAASAALQPNSTVLTPLSRTISRSSSAASGMSAISSISSAHSSASVATNVSSVSEPSITQLASIFLQEYARSHDTRDIDTLIDSLNRAGIRIPAELIYTLSRPRSESVVSLSPCLSSVSPASGYQSPLGASSVPAPSDPAHSQAPSISPSPMPTHQSAVYAASVSPDPYASYGQMHHHHGSAHHYDAGKMRSSIQSSHGTKGQMLGTLDTIAAIKANQAVYFTSSSRNGKRFTCAVCKKNFDRLFNLRSHAKTHIPVEERDTPFYCPIADCNKGFVRKHDTLRHYKTVHVKRGELATPAEVEAATSGRGRPQWDTSTDSVIDAQAAATG